MSFGSRIRAARKAKRMTQDNLAQALGGDITVQAISQWENDKTVPTYERLVQLSDILGVEVGEAGIQSSPQSELHLVPPGPLTPAVVAGRVAAGIFREVDDLDQSEAERVWETPDEKFPHARRMAFDVEGDSMNQLKPRPIMEGDRLICVAFEDVADRVRIRDGLVVVVERTRDGGHTREWSVKQVELYEDRIEFHPRSTNPAHKPIVVKRDAQADDGVQVEIIALVRAVRNEFPL